MVLPNRRVLLALASTVSLCVLLGGNSAWAQSAPAMPGRSIFDAGQPGLGDVDRRQRAEITNRGNRDYGPISIGSWLFSPSIDAGVLYDDNIYQSHTNKISAWGVRLQPRFVALRETGIHDTTVYGLADARFYPDNTNANAVDARLGLAHRYEIQRDLVWRFQAEYARRTEDLGTYTVADPFGPRAIYSGPQEYNQFFGSTSLQKTWGRFFAGIGGAAQVVRYDDTTDSLGRRFSHDDENGNTYRLVGRAGYQLTPVFYSFVESSVDWWRYELSAFDSRGYRVVGGIGSDRISLFKGELYAGYQRQDFDDARYGTIDGGTFGGRISWFPTRDLTFQAVVDQALGVSTPSGSVIDRPSVTNTTSAFLEARWLALRNVSLAARVGYQFVDYERSPREDDVWRAGLGLTYMLTPRLGLVADYDYLRQVSDVPADSYTRNRVTLGARAQF